MDVLSAAASELLNGRLLLAALAVLVVYALACALWPFTAHGRCEGSGKLRSPGGRNWRPCPGCRGTGTKLRIGRRVWGAATSRTGTRRRP